MFNNLWNNLAFWQILFLTVIVSLIIIKILTFLDKKIGVFKKYKIHDLDIYNKLEASFSEEDFTTFLNDIETKNSCQRETLLKVNTFKEVVDSPNFRYKSEILRSKVDTIINNLGHINKFVINNFSDKGSSFIFLQPAEQDNSEADLYSIGADKKNQDFLVKKEELKLLIEKTRNEYLSYRAIIKSYLNV